MLGYMYQTQLGVGAAVVILASGVLLYIVAPIRVRSQQIKPLKAKYESLDAEQLPQEFSATFRDASDVLQRCGFLSAGVATRLDSQIGQASFVELFINAGHNDSAQVIAVRTPRPSAPARLTALLTFRTEFTDGTVIVTTNSATGSCFPPDPQIDSVRWRGCADLERLYQFHRARVKRDSGTRRATLKDVTSTVQRLENEHVRTFNRLTAACYFVVDEPGARFIPTIKGAFLMTYRLLPPWKQLNQYIKDRRAGRVREELGF
jgi:hypothetical protein